MLALKDSLPYLGKDHLDAALEEQLAAAESVDGGDGDEGGEHVDEAGDDGGDEGGVLIEPDGLEEHRCVERDDVDAKTGRIADVRGWDCNPRKTESLVYILYVRSGSHSTTCRSNGCYKGRVRKIMHDEGLI